MFKKVLKRHVKGLSDRVLKVLWKAFQRALKAVERPLKAVENIFKRSLNTFQRPSDDL